MKPDIRRSLICDSSIDGCLLSSTYWKQKYLHFLATDFCEENMLFFDSVEEYRTNPTQKQAISVYSKYVLRWPYVSEHRFFSESSPLEVNLPAEMRKNIGNIVKKMLKKDYIQDKNTKEKLSCSDDPNNPSEEMADPKMFDECQHNVKKMLFTDSFTRFRSTSFYSPINVPAGTSLTTSAPSLVPSVLTRTNPLTIPGKGGEPGSPTFGLEYKHHHVLSTSSPGNSSTSLPACSATTLSDWWATCKYHYSFVILLFFDEEDPFFDKVNYTTQTSTNPPSIALCKGLEFYGR